MSIKIAIIGAGSRSFAPATIKDVLLSDSLNEVGFDLVLMDIKGEHLPNNVKYAHAVSEKLNRTSQITATTSLVEALDGADYAVVAIERDRWLLWSQDFHIPRQYGFKQVFGENGGPGSIFHFLRNIEPMVTIAQEMERLCPDGILLNYTNPEHKLVEGMRALTSVASFGLCHGVVNAKGRLAAVLGMKAEDLETVACGMNHFCVFQKLADRRTGQDLYPKLRKLDEDGDILAKWHEMALGRIIFRRFGLWPVPAANHYGEYIRWASEFVASEAQYFYDPALGHPWETGTIPEFVYTMEMVRDDRPWIKPESALQQPQIDVPERSNEIAVPIIESLACDIPRVIDNIIVPNEDFIPNLPTGMAVEVPASLNGGGISPHAVDPLPEAIAAIIRTQASIQKLIVEAYAERSKDKLIQAVLLDPTVDSYRNAIVMIDNMMELQKEYLPVLE